MNHSKQISIINAIYRELMSSEFLSDIGLHSGTSGIALFFAYYNRIMLNEKRVSNNIVEILKYNIESIDSGNRQYTICTGISGFGWLCEHLKRICILKKRDVLFLRDLDIFLYKMMIYEIKNGNYDYLHGALGIAIYFLPRINEKKINEYIKHFLCELEHSAIVCVNGDIKWISILDHNTGKKGSNISLSHGMSSIVSFLVYLHELDFEVKLVEKLLSNAISYILNQITYVPGNLSYFPSYSKSADSGNLQSRIGWCYGDLGICYVLLKAAVRMKNVEWENISLHILKHSTNRRNMRENGICDGGICHGSAGAALIFWDLYLKTRLQIFKDTADYWFGITLQMRKDTGILNSFMAWREEKFGGPVKCTSLLEGIAGIGLVLLSRLKSDEIIWNECLLLT